LPAGEADSPLLEQKQSPAPTLCLSNNPTPLLVLADIKQWDRFIDDAGVRPVRKIHHSRWSGMWPTLFCCLWFAVSEREEEPSRKMLAEQMGIFELSKHGLVQFT
jgi:hypothetical protein